MPLVSLYNPRKHKTVDDDVYRGYRQKPVAWNALKETKTSKILE